MKLSRMSAANSPLDTERAFSPARSRSDQSNIRGRISGPIPIATPLDDDFPIRNQPAEEGLRPAPVSQSFEPEPSGHGSLRNQTPPQSIHMRSRSSPVGPTGLRAASGQKQRETPPAARQSAFSIGTSGSKSSPQRKKSILRGAIGRLFGRKKKSTSQIAEQSDESNRPTPDSWAQQHRSTALTTPIAEDPSAEQRRSTPFTHDDYGRALRSHTVDDKDMSAIERSRTLAHTESNFSRRRPGGSGVLSIRERRAVAGELGGLSPRPASVHARLSSQEFASSDPEEIGRAITSDYSGLKRRSRSLSAINGPGNLDGRRSRSGEIRYWRQSYDPGYKSPVASSHHPEAEDRAYENLEAPQLQEEEPVPASPLQPFTFGDMASMNEMAGMKITQAATIESRLGRLEERMDRLERNFSGASHMGPGYRPPSRGQEPSIGLSAPPVSFKSGLSSAKFPAYQTIDTTSHQQSPSFFSSRLSGLNRPLETHSPVSSNDRPLSTSTIRAATSLPSLSQELSRPLTGEHYTTLMALLETERSARQALEAQVKTLGHQISILSKASNSLDKSRRFSRQKSAFDYDYDDDAEDETGTTHTKPTEDRYLVSQDSSMNTHGRGEDDSTSYATSADGDVYPESPTYAKTARTLSLSQLTYNRPAAKPSGEPMPNVI